MANNFPKEIRVLFDEMTMGFEDQLAITKHVRIHKTDPKKMERSSDVEWISVPHIATDVDGTPGTDTSASFVAKTRLAVPVSLNRSRMVAYRFNDKELRDAIQEDQMRESAAQKLASVINVGILSKIADEGSNVVAQSGAPVGYVDGAKASASLTRKGVPMFDRCLGLNPDDAIEMSADIANRQRLVQGEMTGKAYEDSYLGKVARFDVFEMDYGTRLPAAAGAGDTIDTTSGAADYVPLARDVNDLPVDNRTQQITVSNTTGVVAGDCFTIAGCEEVHLITKVPTGHLQTFRVRSVDSGTTMTISPPIIAASNSPTEAEKDYKNCEFTSTSATAAITYINTTLTTTNVFWQKDSIKLVPGIYGNPMADTDNILKYTLKNGIQVVVERIRNGYTKETDFRVDVYFDIVNLNPLMNGILLFNQA